MDHNERPVLLHRDHFQRTTGVVIPQDQEADPRVLLLHNPFHYERVGQHLPDASLADLVPTSRLGELDSNSLIIV